MTRQISKPDGDVTVGADWTDQDGGTDYIWKSLRYIESDASYAVCTTTSTAFRIFRVSLPAIVDPRTGTDPAGRKVIVRWRTTGSTDGEVHFTLRNTVGGTVQTWVNSNIGDQAWQTEELEVTVATDLEWAGGVQLQAASRANTAGTITLEISLLQLVVPLVPPATIEHRGQLTWPSGQDTIGVWTDQDGGTDYIWKSLIGLDESTYAELDHPGGGYSNFIGDFGSLLDPRTGTDPAGRVFTVRWRLINSSLGNVRFRVYNGVTLVQNWTSSSQTDQAWHTETFEITAAVALDWKDLHFWLSGRPDVTSLTLQVAGVALIGPQTYLDQAQQLQFLLRAQPFDPAIDAERPVEISSGGYATPVVDTERSVPTATHFRDGLTTPNNVDLTVISGGRFLAGASAGFGTISVANGDRRHDALLHYRWEDRQIDVWFGPLEWIGRPLAEFFDAYSARVAGVVDRRGSNTIELQLRDLGQIFDQDANPRAYLGFGVATRFKIGGKIAAPHDASLEWAASNPVAGLEAEITVDRARHAVIFDRGGATGLVGEILADGSARLSDRGATNRLTTPPGMWEWGRDLPVRVSFMADTAGLRIYVDGDLRASNGTAFGAAQASADLILGQPS